MEEYHTNKEVRAKIDEVFEYRIVGIGKCELGDTCVCQSMNIDEFIEKKCEHYR